MNLSGFGKQPKGYRATYVHHGLKQAYLALKGIHMKQQRAC